MGFVNVLRADTNEEVHDQVYFTEVVKCSSPEDEQRKLDPVVAKECIRNWLEGTVPILTPRLCNSGRLCPNFSKVDGKHLIYNKT
jgi:hypothetical protein